MTKATKATKAKKLKRKQPSGDVTNGLSKRKKVLKKKLKFAEEKKADIVDESKCSSSDTPKQSFDFDRLRAFRYCIDEKYQAERNFFMKRDPSNMNCMTVTNVPSFISTDSLKSLFTKFLADNHAITDIVVQRSTSLSGDLSEGYRTVSVHFDNEYAVEAALRNCQDVPLVRLSDEGIEPLPCGPAKFAREYRNAYVPIDELQRQVDEYMNDHDTKVTEEKRKAKRMRNAPDEEGWITVTRASRKPPPAAVLVKSRKELDKLSNKKNEPKENLAFYSFQLKESKVKRLEELRAKFEEDKKKIALAKAARKFRPS